ncbi:MAG: hypothetical protein H6828_13025 [Planctomycetes bacterium]|nr:hypothetical protein [Planctomycetota bacterium]
MIHAQSLLCLALAFSPGTSAAPPPAPPVLALDDVEKARAAARDRLIGKLEELAEWCTKNKLFASRVGVYESLLYFDPEHDGAHRGLGFKKGKNGEWLPPKKTREPKDWDKGALAEFPARRAALVTEYRDEMLALLASLTDASDAQRESIYADILYADPDDATVRSLRGEVKKDGVWVLSQTTTADTRRAALSAVVVQAFEQAPVPQKGEPEGREVAIGVPWTAVMVTPDVRVLCTGTEAEAARISRAVHAARLYFNAAFGVEAEYPVPLRVFSLSRTSDKLAFLMGHPDIDEGLRKFLMDLDGSGIPGHGDLAHWGPDEPRRLDGLVREAIGFLVSDSFGIGTQQGWISEGFGLYMTKQLVGTRLTWFVRPSDYLTPEEDQKLKARLMASGSNWMAEAKKLLPVGEHGKLQFLLGKDVNKLTTMDLLQSYVLAAYLLEAEAERLPGLLKAIGEGATSQQAFQDVLGLDLFQLDERARRWLAERP